MDLYKSPHLMLFMDPLLLLHPLIYRPMFPFKFTLPLEEDIEVILYHILGTVNSFFSRNEHMRQTKTPEMKQEEFKAVVSNAARPFLTAKTDRFVIELELFLASGLNIEAYDEVYLQQMGWNTPKTTEAAGESIEHNPVVPYLYIFDADSEND
ncbi:hypothetical protein NC653_012818 [Populus alba x Populus x berolinensis]|nr:hypothetical protein NC653_012818 [Populus alba x Populus x berolinensis]